MNDRISWDSYFMGIAKLVRERSEDPCCKVGACIIKDNKIISTGYNGMPSRSEHGIYPWTKGDTDPTKNKYFYVVHAELNAILNSEKSLKGSTLYVTKFPCNECAKAIIQSGISKVIFTDDISLENLQKDDKFIATCNMLMNSYIVVNEYYDTGKSIVISI